ncbi:MAG: hypothetical protein HYW78_00905 [Parcubacteria group bacterium]|nr:hypothetical protein [Parcubacteria group bacterium]
MRISNLIIVVALSASFFIGCGKKKMIGPDENYSVQYVGVKITFLFDEDKVILENKNADRTEVEGLKWHNGGMNGADYYRIWYESAGGYKYNDHKREVKADIGRNDDIKIGINIGGTGWQYFVIDFEKE